MNITTVYKANDKGTGKILAKGGGKQRTVAWDHSFTREQNYANAAAALLLYGHGFTGAGVDPQEYTYREKDHAHIFKVVNPSW